MAKNKGGRPENLVPNEARTPEERRANARKAGIASGQARREKKLLSQIYAEMLAKKHDINIDGKKSKVSGQKIAETVALQVLLKRDSASVSMLKEMREATEGSKSKLNIEGDRKITFELVEPKKKKKDAGTKKV